MSPPIIRADEPFARINIAGWGESKFSPPHFASGCRVITPLDNSHYFAVNEAYEMRFALEMEVHV